MNIHGRSKSFVFLRHALSEGNREGIIQGQSDFPLADQGIEQVNLLIRFWEAQNRRFDRIFSSPLLRAKDTAEPIAAALACELKFDDIWMERDHGDAQGVQYDRVHELYADRPTSSPFEPIFGSGESEWELHIRACRAIEHLIKQNQGAYLIVSHGGFLGAMVRSILGIAPSSGRTRTVRISFANTGYAELRFDHKDARWYIDALNSTTHLYSPLQE